MSLVSFQMPGRVVVEKVDMFHSIFSFQPLEKGYGTTVGNVLRRVLLSSLEGYAITTIKIPGIRHEFSIIEGVREDLVAIILNLKQVRFKKILDSEENKIEARVKNSVFKAGDFAKFTSSFEVLNPDFVICNLDGSREFDLEVQVEKGRGYLAAEENRSSNRSLDIIPIDVIFSPIVKVAYRVDNIRVGQKTDYEKLTIEIQTDGSISPEEGLQEAAKVIMKHLNLVCGKEMVLESIENEEDNALDEEILHMKKILRTKIVDMHCSARVLNCLKSANIVTLGDLVQLKLSDMMRFRNFGKKSRAEIEKILSDRNLKFDMDLSKYKLDIDKIS